MGTLQRAYRRLGPRYLDVYLVVYVLPAMLIGLAAAACVTVYVDLTSGELARFLLVSQAILALSLTASVVAIHRSLRPTREWVARGGGREGAERAWRRVVRTPVAVHPAKVAGGTLLVALPIAVYAAADLGLDVVEALVVFAAVLVAFSYHLLLSVFGAELYLRPVVEHVTSDLEDAQLKARPVLSLRRRLLISLPLIAGSSAIVVAVLTERDDARLDDLGTEFAIVVAVVGLTTIPLVSLVVRAILRPVAALLDATRRLKAGDLAARAPVLHEDELGILTATFNEMAAELQHSRGELVAAREEERRRLRRDLHDGLGPSLAAVTMRLDVAAGLLDRNGDATPADAAVRAEIDEASAELRDAIGEIRRLVDDLRPPRLDELGLVGAIRARVARLSRGAPSSPDVDVEVSPPGGLGELPAAVEVAAYRIVQEALTNAGRHSRARRCVVRLERGDDLVVEVHDDGRGLVSEASDGVGLVSMRERAAEVGGACTIERAPGGGVRVLAVLPVELA